MSNPPAPLHVAIVGAGPAGFYAAESLQKAVPDVRVDLLDRLPTPYGLVRGGVAPDHPKIKSVTRVFDRIASHPGFRYLGHLRVGETVSVGELRRSYDAVIFATGAETDRSLGIPGEQLPGSLPATELVGWYNGHPDFVHRAPDLTGTTAIVVGIGNVALDVARIFARTPASLAHTDITPEALAVLRDSHLRTIHVVARRGPVQAACTPVELKEFGELEGVEVAVDAASLELDPASAADLAEDRERNAVKNLEILRQFAAGTSGTAHRRVVFHFNRSPVELLGTDRVTGIRLERNRLERDPRGGIRAVGTGTFDTLEADLVVRAVGHQGVAIPGLPFDHARGIVPNIEGRVVEAPGSTAPMAGLYVAGWIKRGPAGVIGTNKACAASTVERLLADHQAGALPTRADDADLVQRLAADGAVVTTWADWQALDRIEQERGKSQGQPRRKVTSLAEMLDLIAAHRIGAPPSP